MGDFEESWIFMVRGKAQVRENTELIRKFTYERGVDAGLGLGLGLGYC